MTTEPHVANKAERRQAIREIVAREGVGSQRELVDRLVRRGIAATQATVSRDIADLALVKLWRGRRHVYVLPEDMAGPAAAAGPAGPGTVAAPAAATERLRRILADIPIRVARSGLILVLTGSPGTASVIAQAIDESPLDEQVGTVAGDNTLLVLFADPPALERWRERFSQLQRSASNAIDSEVPR
ncbi:MAG TPA: arginine repressor [Candidatus Eisenbacteria bacterium]|nr:arginine repressor [Candidatus Eisenbacteria bacterium]